MEAQDRAQRERDSATRQTDKVKEELRIETESVAVLRRERWCALEQLRKEKGAQAGERERSTATLTATHTATHTTTHVAAYTATHEQLRKEKDVREGERERSTATLTATLTATHTTTHVATHAATRTATHNSTHTATHTAMHEQLCMEKDAQEGEREKSTALSMHDILIQHYIHKTSTIRTSHGTYERAMTHSYLPTLHTQNLYHSLALLFEAKLPHS